MIYHFAKAVKTACRNGFTVSTFYNRYERHSPVGNVKYTNLSPKAYKFKEDDL